MLIRIIALFCFVMLTSLQGQAQSRMKDFRGFIDIRPGVSLYTEFTVRDQNKPTIILVNGLTYHTKYWFSFATALAPYGYNVLKYDPRGMGQTLLRDGFPKESFAIEQQAEDLQLLINKLKIPGPLTLLGLSYGGGLSMAYTRLYPQRVRNLILVAPYTEPVTGADLTIRGQIHTVRMTQPWNSASDDELYGFFLRQQVYYTNPVYEPATLEFPLKPEGIYRLVEGIRKYDFFEAAKYFPPRSTHLVVAAFDQYIPRDLLNKFWNAVPAGARGSRVLVQFSEHKVPESQPTFLAYWVDQILQNNPEAFRGRSYEANPLTKKLK